MTNKEITEWIEKHAGVRQRIAEIYRVLENQKDQIQALRNQYHTHNDRLHYAETISFQISRLCMKSKNPEKTLESIYSLTMTAHKKISNV